MKKYTIYFILLSLVLYFQIAESQHSMYKYQMKDGLSQLQAVVLFESKEGDVYVGTKNGVNKFLPRTGKFVNYFSSNEYPNGFIQDIKQLDAGQMVYFAPMEGVYVSWNGKKELIYSEVNEKKDIRAISIIKNKQIIIGQGKDSIYFFYIPQNRTHCTERTAIALPPRGSFSSSMQYDKRNKRLLGTYIVNDTTVLVQIELEFKGLNKMPKFKSPKIIWKQKGTFDLVASENHFYVFSNDTSNKLRMYFKINEEKITSIKPVPYKDYIEEHFVDELGIIYYNSDLQIHRFNPVNNNVESVTKTSSEFRPFNATCMLCTHDSKAIWVGGEYGCQRINIDPIFTVYNQDNLKTDSTYVWGVVRNKNDKLFFATYGKGLFEFDEKTNTTKKIIEAKTRLYEEKDGNISLSTLKKIDLFYVGVIKARNGDVFLPYNNGVLKYDGTQFSSAISRSPNNSDRIKAGAYLYTYEDVDSNQYVFVGTSGAVIQDIKTGKETHYTLNDLKAKKHLLTTVRDDYGNRWFGTRIELIKRTPEGKVFKYQKDADSLSIPSLGNMCSIKTSDGTIWFGATNGLLCLRKNQQSSQQPIQKIGGMVGGIRQPVNCMALLSNDKILLGLTDCMIIIDTKAYLKGEKQYLKEFNALNSDFQGYDMGQNGLFYDKPNNTAWVVTPDNVIKCDIAKMLAFEDNFDLKCEYDQKVTLGEIKLQKDTLNTLPSGVRSLLVLDNNYSQLQVRINGSDFETVKKNAPINLGGAGVSTIVFKRDGLFENTYKINILPFYWYEKTWVLAIIILLVLFGIFASLYAYKERKQRKKIQKEEELLKRDSQLQQIKMGIMQSENDGHFLGNLVMSLQDMIDNNNDRNRVNAILADYARYYKDVRMINEIEVPLKVEIESVKLYLSLEQYRFPELTFDVKIEDNVNLQIPVFKLLIQLHVNNAVKHGIEKNRNAVGHVAIHIQQQEHYLVITVTDNGQGRKKDMLQSEGKGTQLLADFFTIRNIKNHYPTKQHYYDVEPNGTKVVINYAIML
jgi:hypothetical protein